MKERRGGAQGDTITVLKKVPKYMWKGKCIRMWNDLIFPASYVADAPPTFTGQEASQVELYRTHKPFGESICFK